MLARPTLKRTADRAEDQPPPGQPRPAEQRFLLKVDGQAKRSFAEKEAAVRVGSEIKRKYPVVIVTVTDSADGSTETIG